MIRRGKDRVLPLTLTSGTRLGAFVISSPLGAGGMGEVYRAHDTTLGRDVAIKILPADFSRDSDRLARFRREAQVLASLNHPNIATIHGIQDSDGVHALVLELVEGPTLENWIALRAARRSSSNLRSHTTLGDTVAIARQIAEALDAAHERGIVHRDLKPANVKVAPDGRVKVLDFGLAKARDATETAGQPTATSLHTDAGVVLGTAPYMSPEQARGSPVDRRTDIWAFGCILYELLTGRRAFASGETASDTLAAILALDPDWSALPRSTPERLRRLVTHCLEKDPRERLRDIGDALPDLRDGPDEAAPSSAGTRASDPRALLLGAVALLATVVATYFAVRAMRQPPAGNTAFTVEAPEGGALTVGQPFSPDGTKLAFIAPTSAGAPVVWVRPIDSIAARKLDGTEGAVDVFWSPDSQNLGFFAGGELKRIPAAGGAIQVICSVDAPEGGSWGSQNVILIGTHGPLLRVSAAGGKPTAASVIDVQGDEQFHEAPEFLPDGRQFLFVALGQGLSAQHAFVGSLGSNDRRALDGVQSAVRYSSTGHVLFTRDGALLAQTFDVDKDALSGEPFQVADRAAGVARMPFSVSATGSLAYLTLPDQETELRWFDRSGVSLGLAAPKGMHQTAELSPDGTRVAFQRISHGNWDIWVLDFATGSETRVTSDPGPDYGPLWSPDNRTLAFTSYRTGFGRVFRNEVGGAAGEVPVQENTVEQRVTDWSTDDRYLAYEQNDRNADRLRPTDLWAVAVEGGSDPIRLTSTDADEHNPRFSPDVRWVAYDSNESGRREVYVQSFPRVGHRQAVSVGGGRTPRWKPDGTELFYLTDDGAVMAVSVTPTPDGARFGPPTRLFRADVQFNGLVDRAFNVSRDGRFLLDIVPAGRSPPPIVVLQNWAAHLRR